MDYTKIDAALAAELSQEGLGQEYLVSVRTLRPLTEPEQEEFSKLGGLGVNAKIPVLSARVTRPALEQLVSKPWLRSVSLAQKLQTYKKDH